MKFLGLFFEDVYYAVRILMVAMFGTYIGIGRKFYSYGETGTEMLSDDEIYTAIDDPYYLLGTFAMGRKIANIPLPMVVTDPVTDHTNFLQRQLIKFLKKISYDFQEFSLDSKIYLNNHEIEIEKLKN